MFSIVFREEVALRKLFSRNAFLERLPRAEWDDPFGTTFWSLGNLRLAALHGVVPHLVDHHGSESRCSALQS